MNNNHDIRVESMTTSTEASGSAIVRHDSTMIELFKIFTAPMSEGSQEYTISMDVNRGTLVLLGRKGDVVKETHMGLLWCHTVNEVGLTIQEWFKLGYPVEIGWAYPAMLRGPEALGFFIQGVARMAERMNVEYPENE